MDINEEKELLQDITKKEYKEGFVTDVDQDFIPKGLNEDIVRMISERKGEPQWLLDFRLDAFRKWQKMEMPDWGHLDMPHIDYQDIIYYAAPLIVADEGSKVSYMEGCTAPMRDENQLHAAVVEIVALKDADVKYSTVQNWYPGDENGRGGILNLVTKRGICMEGAHLSWTQVETGSAITWKYPSTILKGDYSSSEFYSVAVTNNYQQADTGTKMIHVGKGTRSRIVSKGISAGHSQNSYRGLVRMLPGAAGARNFSQCDSLLIGSLCGAHTFPDVRSDNATAVVEHEATTSKIKEDQLFYCNQRGIGPEDAVGLIVNGYAREVLSKLPMEFAVEAQKLLQVSLEGSVG